jgi:hypothetical protein
MRRKRRLAVNLRGQQVKTAKEKSKKLGANP